MAFLQNDDSESELLSSNVVIAGSATIAVSCSILALILGMRHRRNRRRVQQKLRAAAAEKNRETGFDAPRQKRSAGETAAPTQAYETPIPLATGQTGGRRAPRTSVAPMTTVGVLI